MSPSAAESSRSGRRSRLTSPTPTASKPRFSPAVVDVIVRSTRPVRPEKMSTSPGARRAVAGGVRADREVDAPVAVDVAGLAARAGAVAGRAGQRVDERAVAAGVHAGEAVAASPRGVVGRVEVGDVVAVDAPDAGDEERARSRGAPSGGASENSCAVAPGEDVRTARAALGQRADDQVGARSRSRSRSSAPSRAGAASGGRRCGGAARTCGRRTRRRQRPPPSSLGAPTSTSS